MKTCRFLLPALMAGLIFAMTSHAAPLDSSPAARPTSRS